MEKLDSSGVIATYEGTKDKLPRDATGVRLRVTCRMHGHLMDRGHILSRGTQEVVILKRDLQSIIDNQVWDDEEPSRIKRAEDEYARMIDFEVAETADWLTVEQVEVLRLKGPEAFRKRYKDLKSDAVDVINAKRAEQEAKSGLSVEGAFHKLYHRGIKPIMELEVIADNIDLSEDRETRAKQKAFAVDIVQAMQAGGAAPAGYVRVEDVERIVSEKLEAALEALTGSNGGASKKK